MSKKKSTKKRIITGVCVLVMSAVMITMVCLFGPDAIPMDWSKVQRVPNHVELLGKDDPRNPTPGTVSLVKYTDDTKSTVDTSPWKILQFTDMHLTQEHDTNLVTLDNFLSAIKRERPDFVALTGDIITRPEGRPRAVQLAEAFEKMGIYWCYCLGNHEGDSDPFTLSREELIRIWAKYPHCLVEDEVKKTAAGVEVWGLGNTAINLLGDVVIKTEGEVTTEYYQVVQSLVFLDSGNRISTEDYNRLKKQGVTGIEEGCYDFLKQSQIDWYAERVTEAAAVNDKVKSMLFIHIPLVEMSYINLLEEGSVLPDGWYYAYPDNPYYVGDTLYGDMIVKEGWHIVGDTASYEKCYCSDYNSGMYDKMIALRKNVNALFCGHDHVNNTIFYEGDPKTEDDTVYLCYGIGSGSQSYNLYSLGLSKVDDYHLRGYQKIVINADSSFDLYQIRYNNVNKEMQRIKQSKPIDEIYEPNTKK